MRYAIGLRLDGTAFLGEEMEVRCEGLVPIPLDFESQSRMGEDHVDCDEECKCFERGVVDHHDHCDGNCHCWEDGYEAGYDSGAEEGGDVESLHSDIENMYDRVKQEGERNLLNLDQECLTVDGILEVFGDICRVFYNEGQKIIQSYE